MNNFKILFMIAAFATVTPLALADVNPLLGNLTGTVGKSSQKGRFLALIQ